MSPLLRIVSLMAAVAPATACVQVYPPTAPSPAGSPQAAAAKADSAKDKAPFKKWDEVLKDTRAIQGYFTFHLKRDNTLYLELPPAALGREFGMALYIARGVADFGLNAGLPASATQLMHVERVGDQIHLVHLNPRFVADSGSPMQAAVRANIGHSVVAAFKIESEQKETKHLLVDVTPFFVSDYADFAEWLKVVYRNKPVTFEKDRSHVGRILAFPRNVEVEAELTFRAQGVPWFGADGVADYRVVPLTVRYSLFALPDEAMRPRLADDRVGHFLTAVWDYSRDRQPTRFVRYVDRWRLEKKDPASEVSEPVQPIVYYVDHSVPREYRRYVKEGIEAWNKAFAAAGFSEAIVAREAPDDTAWSAEDIRYSTVRWTADPGAWAIGPHETDPRSGEILNADILISTSYVTYMVGEYQQFSGPDALVRHVRERRDVLERFPVHLRDRLCFAAQGKAHQMAVQHALLVGLGVLEGGKPVPEGYLGDAIRDLVMHEVGHTLGLRHNFRGSSGIPYDRLHDTTFTRRHGVTLSVMDYGAVNVAADPAQQGDYWNTAVGTYDVWAIQYAYMPIVAQRADGPLKGSGASVTSPEAERAGLEKIARQAADPLHTYGTDEDNWLGPWAVDPLTNGWDLGSDPLRFAEDRVAIVRRVEPALEGRLVDVGEGYQRLRSAFASLLSERFLALLPVTKTVGGLYVARDHKGDPDGRPPFRPVPAERQRAAVRVIVEQALADDAFRFDPVQLNKLAPNRWAHWGVPWFSAPLDFPVHDWVQSIQGFLVVELLDPARLRRMIDNEVRTPAGAEPYRASELFETLTAAVWSEVPRSGAPRNVSSFRRNLQRTHLEHLAALLVDPRWGAPEDAKSLARFELTDVAARIDAALAGGASLDRVTRAHLGESRARIERVLETALTIPVGRP